MWQKGKKASLAYFLTKLECRPQSTTVNKKTFKKVIAAAVLHREEPPFFASRLLLQKLLWSKSESALEGLAKNEITVGE